MTTQTLSPALTWDDLAKLYKERTGRTARIRSMDSIFNWALSQKDIHEDPNEGTLQLKKSGGQ
jgi:hypothetical protein